MSKKHNFSAGPCILPQEVFQKSAEAILDFNGSGLSLLEISHRSKDFVAVMDEARAIVKRLMKLGDDYEVLYLGGGASLQFAMVPFNLMKTENGKAAYTDTGTWAAGAIKEGKKLGTVDVVGSSKEENYSFIPKNYSVGSEYDYFHCTSNNTIYGTQMREFPKVDTLLVCDMSSDIFSRVIDFSQFDLIYAGGIAAAEVQNEAKAKLLYDEIDRNALFETFCNGEDRSLMNATFKLLDDTRKEEFDNAWKAAGISGLNGHRSVGGYRASMYNALPLESVQVLVDVMKNLN